MYVPFHSNFNLSSILTNNSNIYFHSVQFSLVNIAASIPLIRPLFVVTRTQRTDPNYAYSLAKYGNTSSSRAHVGYRLDDHTHRNTITHDGSSAENILTSADMFEDMNDMEMAIIKKTTYGVMYDTKKSSSWVLAERM